MSQTTDKPRKPNKRSAARLAAVQALYQMDLAQTDLRDLVERFLAEPLRDQDDDGEKAEYVPPDPKFFEQLVRGVVDRQRDIDPLVDHQLAQGWRLIRVDSTLRALLRAGVFELLAMEHVPARVVITEYVDVAHAFFDGDEPRVTNGVLDKIARELRPQDFGVPRNTTDTSSSSSEG